MKYLIIIFTIMTAGCATVPSDGPARSNKLFKLEKSDDVAPGDGVIVLSAGRENDPCDECNANLFGILPFVSYHIFQLLPDEQYKEVAFLQAEAGMWNQISKEHYGFVHLRELPAGKYLMIGVNSRGYNMMFAASGFFVTVGDSGGETGVAFEFEVEPGKINYLGQFLTTNGNLVNSSINLSRHEYRDLGFAYKEYPLLERYEVINTVPKNSNKRVN